MKQKMKYTIFSIIVLILLFSGMLFYVNTKTETIDIGYKKHLAYLPLFVALERGYFGSLEVNPVVFDSTNQMIGAVVSGNIDAAIGGANLQTVFSVEEKSPGELKIFSTIRNSEESLFSCVMVKEGFKDIADLKGARIATLPGTFAPLWIEATLETISLKNDDIEIIEIAPNLQLAALESEQVDALFTVEPVCSFGVNKGIAKIIYENPMKHLSKEFAASVFSSDFKYAKRVVSATDKAIDFIRSNPEESMQIMAKYTGYKEELIAGMVAPDYSKSDEIDSSGVQELADTLFAAGNLNKKINTEELIFR